ncbi:MAG TPA: hypothetical protein VFG95_00480 [Nitrospiria bacterium]|nr:hypothetical protein [Nitrospiria bacterium]
MKKAPVFLITIMILFFVTGTAVAVFESGPSSPETIRGKITYKGPANVDLQTIVVEAHQRGNFGDRPVSRATLKGPGDYELKIKSGIYYLRAFVDRNGNGTLDENEPVGEYDKTKAVVLPPLSSKMGVNIVIEE